MYLEPCKVIKGNVTSSCTNSKKSQGKKTDPFTFEDRPTNKWPRFKYIGRSKFWISVFCVACQGEWPSDRDFHRVINDFIPLPSQKKREREDSLLEKKKKKKRKRKNLPIKMISTQLIHVHEAKNRKLIFVIIHICECEVCEKRGIVRTGRNLSSRNTRSTIRHSSPTGKHEKRTKWGRKRERQRERERERESEKQEKKGRKKERKERGRNYEAEVENKGGEIWFIPLDLAAQKARHTRI